MMIASDRLNHQPTEVASKVLRRAQVSKMTRALQDRLALANVKIKHGWENLSLDSIEPQIDKELKRKRPQSSANTVISDASSTFSDRRIYHNTSPLAPPIFSDDNRGLGSSRRSNGNSSFPKRSFRNDAGSSLLQCYPASSRQARRPGTATKLTTSWKKAHRLPESSPNYRSKRSRYDIPQSQAPSFVSETSTIPNDPISPYISTTTSCSDENVNHNGDDDDQDLPIASFNADITQIRSSPPATTITTNTSMTPRTPSPDRQCGLGNDGTISTRQLHNQAFKPQSRRSQNRRGNNNGGAGAEGADLLLYLATSPSPANAGNDNNDDINNDNAGANDLPEARTPRSHRTTTTITDAAPSTPPPKQTPLPSSMMTTPGGTNAAAAGGASTMLGFGATTPSVGFNFADFVNITPSPAQGAFSRTPVVGKGDGSSSNNGVPRTPLAAREARRRINFDGLMPMSSSGMNTLMTVGENDDDDNNNNNSGDARNVGQGSGNDNDTGVGGGGGAKRPRGLGMELGGELVS